MIHENTQTTHMKREIKNGPNNMLCVGYCYQSHGSPGSPGSAGPGWLSRRHPQPEPEPQPQPEPVDLASLPRIVQEAFAEVGVEADVTWQPDTPETPLDATWDEGLIDPDDVPPCAECGSYELWESMAGTWRCMKCDPPSKSKLLQRKASRLRRLAVEQG